MKTLFTPTILVCLVVLLPFTASREVRPEKIPRQLRRVDWIYAPPETTLVDPTKANPVHKRTPFRALRQRIPKLMFIAIVTSLVARAIEDLLYEQPSQSRSYRDKQSSTHSSSHSLSQTKAVTRWSLCDGIQGFLVWRFAQTQTLSIGLLAFLMTNFLPGVGPQHSKSYLYGWITSQFIEGFFGGGDLLEGDNGLSLDVIILTILWGCLKSFRLSKARIEAARSIQDAKEQVELMNKRPLNAPALIKIPARVIAESPPLRLLYEMAGDTT